MVIYYVTGQLNTSLLLMFPDGTPLVKQVILYSLKADEELGEITYRVSQTSKLSSAMFKSIVLYVCQKIQIKYIIAIKK